MFMRKMSLFVIAGCAVDQKTNTFLFALKHVGIVGFYLKLSTVSVDN